MGRAQRFPTPDGCQIFSLLGIALLHPTYVLIYTRLGLQQAQRYPVQARWGQLAVTKGQNWLTGIPA